jgi:hypothetical protein
MTTGDGGYGVCLLLRYSKGTWLARKLCSIADLRHLDHVDEWVLRVQHHRIWCVVVDSLFFVHVVDSFWEDTGTKAIYNHKIVSWHLGQSIENLIVNPINYYHYWFKLFLMRLRNLHSNSSQCEIVANKHRRELTTA